MKHSNSGMRKSNVQPWGHVRERLGDLSRNLKNTHTQELWRQVMRRGEPTAYSKKVS